MISRITAVFPHLDEAQYAITDLRSAGVNDAHLSVVTRAMEDNTYPRGAFVPYNAELDSITGTTMHPVTRETSPYVVDHHVEPVGDTMGDRAVKGLLGGAGVGALFGFAAAMIPGAGPFIAAGALATALGSTGGAVTAGAIVGATSGAIAAALSRAGWTSAEAEFYGSELESGRVLVTVNVDEHLGLSTREVRDILTRHGGHIATVSNKRA